MLGKTTRDANRLLSLLGTIPLQLQPARISSQPPDAVWDALMFYEEIAEDRPFLLRRFLPTPIGTQGCKSEVGSDVKCRYVGGHLVKRVTRIIRGHNYAFEIVEQNLALGGIRLSEAITHCACMSKDRTRVALATHYASPNCPRWLFGRLEAAVCHSFHRYILSAMRSNLWRAEIS